MEYIKEDIDIYKMELHLTLRIYSRLLITRVPGGWIYDRIIGDCDFMTSVFVPFDNEFWPSEDRKGVDHET